MNLQIKFFSVDFWKVGLRSSAYTQDLGSNLSPVSYSVNKLWEVFFFFTNMSLKTW